MSLPCAALLAVGAIGDPIAVGSGAPDPMATHPGHYSFAEVAVNRQTGKLEVGLAVLAEDLERVLSLRAEKNVTLEGSTDVDQRIIAYLGLTFRATRVDGKPAAFQWVGKKLDGQDCWLFFTCDLGEAGKRHGFAGVTLTHQVLCDLEPLQMNSVKLMDGRWSRNATFHRQAPSRTLRPAPPAEEPTEEPTEEPAEESGTTPMDPGPRDRRP